MKHPRRGPPTVRLGLRKARWKLHGTRKVELSETFAVVFEQDCRRGLGRVGSYLTRVGLIAGALGCLLGSSVLAAQVAESTKELVAMMLTHEDYEAAHRGHYLYLCKERSDRTGGHLWTEKVVETTAVLYSQSHA